MKPRRSLFTLTLLSLVVSLATVSVSVLHAQDDEDDEDTEEVAPAAPAAPPTKSGRGDVTAAVGQAGMTFDLASGARVFIPPRLPIGDARRMRFAEVRGTLNAAQVAAGFTRIGPVLSFDGAINATSNPVVVSLRQPRDPARPNTRLVLAMEQATICREGLTPLPGSTSLCSAWELIEARWVDGRLEAALPAPGGYRLVFGTVPTS